MTVSVLARMSRVRWCDLVTAVLGVAMFAAAMNHSMMVTRWIGGFVIVVTLLKIVFQEMENARDEQ